MFFFYSNVRNDKLKTNRHKSLQAVHFEEMYTGYDGVCLQENFSTEAGLSIDLQIIVMIPVSIEIIDRFHKLCLSRVTLETFFIYTFVLSF